VKVLFDHNLSPKLARALQAFFDGTHEIAALRDRFAPSITDIDLIEQLSRDGDWVLVSGDRRITRNKAEREAFRKSKVIGLFLSSGLYKAREVKKLERILALWDAIEDICSRVSPGAMFELPMRSARIKQLKY
jgi:predicted nuclease of predicted toxin-antitoxin system